VSAPRERTQDAAADLVLHRSNEENAQSVVDSLAVVLKVITQPTRAAIVPTADLAGGVPTRLGEQLQR